MVKYTYIEVEAPLAEAFRSVGHPAFATAVSVGALIGTRVMMVLMLGQSRVLFAMSRDRLLPTRFAKVSPRSGTPVRPQPLPIYVPAHPGETVDSLLASANVAGQRRDAPAAGAASADPVCSRLAPRRWVAAGVHHA